MLHGVDIWSFETGVPLLDFSININPIGVPEGLKEALTNAFDSVSRYPDIQYRALRMELSEYLHAPMQRIRVGNGAMELIDAILTTVNEVMIPCPSFVEYELRAVARGVRTHFYPLSGAFRLNIEDLIRTIEESPPVNGTGALLLGNPNNPTGIILSEDELRTLYEYTESKGIELILDETFVEFTDPSYDTIQIGLEKDFSHLSVIRAATKFFGIPGLRLGYAVCSQRMTDALEHRMNPWSVNCMAEAAAKTLFRDADYIRESVRYIQSESARMQKLLRETGLFEVYPSRANFILLRCPNIDVEELFQSALSDGFLIRKCANFRGLDESYIRIAVKDRSANERLLQFFRRFRDGKQLSLF